MSLIYHLLRAGDWPVEGVCAYRPPSLAAEGFIHCSTAEQVAATASRYYSGVADLHVLELEVEALTAQLVWENTTGGTEPFPHLYGPINEAAVVQMRLFLR
jgi:uncharacterized protein (DUF952 family)